MEDLATAEISRTQVWQWVQHCFRLFDDTIVSPDLVSRLVDSEMERIARELGDARFASGRFADAKALFLHTATATPLVEFLSLAAYPLLTAEGPSIEL